jgi:hypothetical protein
MVMDFTHIMNEINPSGTAYEIKLKDKAKREDDARRLAL